jgi:hypothetical protein
MKKEIFLNEPNEEMYEALKKSEEISNSIINACYDGDLKLVKNLLLTPNLKIQPDIHFMCDSAFAYALLKKNIKILEYLIMELKIEKTDYIIGYLANPDSRYDVKSIKKAEEWFSKRDLIK